MLRGKTEQGSEIVLSEQFVTDRVGDVVDRLKDLASLLGSVRQREAANIAADAAEWLHVYAQKMDADYLRRRASLHATAVERMMQD